MSSIYEDIGGDKTLSDAVDILFDRALEDDLLKLYFDGLNVARIKNGFKTFVAHLLGGDQPFEGPTLFEIHRGTELSDLGFDTFVEYFLEALKEQNVSSELVESVKAKVLPIKNDVVASYEWRGKHFYVAK